MTRSKKKCFLFLKMFSKQKDQICKKNKYFRSLKHGEKQKNYGLFFELRRPGNVDK